MNAHATSQTQTMQAALHSLGQQDAVRLAEQAVREASTELRWHEALRRRWQEARAESAVRGAVASAHLEGAVVPVDSLRRAIAAGELTDVHTHDPAVDVAAGLWRGHVRVSQWMTPLRGRGTVDVPPSAALVASLHRDLTAPLAGQGRLPHTEVGIARGLSQAAREQGPHPEPYGEELDIRRALLLRLIDMEDVPALVRAAVVHADMVCTRPMTAANAAVGRLLVRHLVTRDGLEPTGVAVPEVYPANAPGAYREAMAAYASGTTQGVTAWIMWQAEALLAGMKEALRVCQAVQAGSTAHAGSSDEWPSTDGVTRER